MGGRVCATFFFLICALGVCTARSCIPTSHPAVTSGTCMTVQEVRSRCVDDQEKASPSRDCVTGTWCCFSDSTSESDAADNNIAIAAGGYSSASTRRPISRLPAGRVCSPRTQPTVEGGVCVLDNQIARKCRLLQLSLSADCGPNQHCCFDTDLRTWNTSRAGMTTPSPGSPMPALGTPTVSGGSGATLSGSADGDDDNEVTTTPAPNTATPQNGGACSPLSNPWVTDGVCWNLDKLSANCRGTQMSKSNQCAPHQFCCFVGRPQPTTGSSQTPTSTTISAPLSDGALTTISSSGLTTADNRTICHPTNHPGVTGKCAPVTQLSRECRALSLTKRATGCSAAEICCFSAPKTTESPVQQTKAPLAGASSSIDNDESDESDNQSTVPQPQPTTQPPAKSFAIKQCHPTSNHTERGQCVSTSGLAKECKARAAARSHDCHPREWCCILPENVIAKNVTLAQATQSAVNNVSLPALVSCTPLDNLSVHNGVCLRVWQFDAQCNKKNVSMSKDCTSGSYCCYDDVAAADKGAGAVEVSKKVEVWDPTGGGQLDVSVKQGTGAAESGNQVSGSVESNEKQQHAPANPARWPVNVSQGVKSQPPVNLPNKQQAAGNPAHPPNRDGVSVIVAAVQMPGTTCSPTSNPAVKDGKCMTVAEVRSNCVEDPQRASPSRDCDSGNWCCFNASDSASDVSNDVAGFPGGSSTVQSTVSAPQ